MLISFRLGAEDARVTSREFAPAFETEDLLNLPNHAIYLKLMIDGAPSGPFSGVALNRNSVERRSDAFSS